MALAWIATDGDSLVIYDRRLRRASVLDSSGALVRSQVTAGLVRQPKSWAALGASGGGRAVLREFSGDEQFLFAQPRGFYVFEQPFGRSSFFRTRGTKLYAAANDAFDIQRYDSSGRLLQIIRMAVDPHSVGSTDFEEWKAARVEGATDDLTGD